MTFKQSMISWTAALAFFAAAAAFMLFAMLTFLDIGLPQPRAVGVMQLESIQIAGIVLRGWQMYLAYLVPAVASLALLVLAVRKVVWTIKA